MGAGWVLPISVKVTRRFLATDERIRSLRLAGRSLVSTACFGTIARVFIKSSELGAVCRYFSVPLTAIFLSGPTAMHVPRAGAAITLSAPESVLDFLPGLPIWSLDPGRGLPREPPSQATVLAWCRLRGRGRTVSNPTKDDKPGRQSRFVRRSFGAEIVDLDGVEFIECKFRGTTLRYSGGEVPRIIGCSFSEARFAVDGPAARTLALLKAMASPGSGLQEVVRETFGALFAS